MGKTDPVLVKLRTAFDSDRGNVRKALDLARYYIDHGHLRQASELFREVLKENPQDFNLLQNMKSVLRKTNWKMRRYFQDLTELS